MTLETTNPTPSVNEDDQPLAGSVKPYQRHMVVCVGGPAELWLAHVEEMQGLMAGLQAALERRKLHKRIKLTACDEVSLGAEGLDILIFPDMVRLEGVRADQAEAVVAALQTGEPWPVLALPLPPGDHLLVCVHANRDVRCGTWGLPLLQALEHEIATQGVPAHLYQSSHIGGHRYAATCIVYPEGVWYGNLRPEAAPRLVSEHLGARRWLADFYRGRYDASSCAQVAEAEALRALSAAYPGYQQLRVEVVEDGKRATAIARAVVEGEHGPLAVHAEFALSCPLIWWTTDDEPIFASEIRAADSL